VSKTHNSVREFVIPVSIAVLAIAPAMVLRVVGESESAPVNAALFGMAILAAGFLLSWGAEAAEKYIAAGFIIAIVALITVLPEYAVDFYYAYRAGQDPSSATSPMQRRTLTGTTVC